MQSKRGQHNIPRIAWYAKEESLAVWEFGFEVDYLHSHGASDVPLGGTKNVIIDCSQIIMICK